MPYHIKTPGKLTGDVYWKGDNTWTVTYNDRKQYDNKSDGFVEIRNLNQAIIIRKQEGDDIGLEKLVTIPNACEGLASCS